MRRRVAIGAFLLVVASTEVCLGADPRYPDWPCTQAKVPEISLAAVWAGPPLDDVSGKWKDDAKVSALVAKLAARRTPLEEAQKAITEYLNGAADKTTSGKQLFAGLFDSLNAQRSQVLNGLERVTRKQREAAEKIRSDFVRFGEPRHGWVGANVAEASDSVEGSRAEVTEVLDTPATEAGIKKGDTIWKYGQDIGIAKKPIRKGEHLHVHNVKTKRW